MRFDYLVEKISAAVKKDDPFPHIFIDQFFDEADFRQIVSAPEISIPHQSCDEGLFEALLETGYNIIAFPGCIIDQSKYIAWHRDKSQPHHYNNSACEGFGITLRLTRASSGIINDLMTFLTSPSLQSVLAKKFNIDMKDVYYDAGIQKYLDGYEISPHPDIRAKALTFMANLNPSALSSGSDHHTHFLKFKDAFKYVQAYWESNPSKDRCWVPWEWCDIQKTHRENNSIVIFAPGNNTLHGVKAVYDHLSYQRTQLYGNFWYSHKVADICPPWEDFLVAHR